MVIFLIVLLVIFILINILQAVYSHYFSSQKFLDKLHNCKNLNQVSSLCRRHFKFFILHFSEVQDYVKKF